MPPPKRKRPAPSVLALSAAASEPVVWPAEPDPEEAGYVPNEMWTLIFEALLAAAPTMRGIVMQVCRQWAAVVTEDARFWRPTSDSCATVSVADEAPVPWTRVHHVVRDKDCWGGLWRLVDKSGTPVAACTVHLAQQCLIFDQIGSGGATPFVVRPWLHTEPPIQRGDLFVDARAVAAMVAADHPAFERPLSFRDALHMVLAADAQRRLRRHLDCLLTADKHAFEPLYARTSRDRLVPAQLAPHVVLHRYQRDALAWMDHLEELAPAERLLSVDPLIKFGMGVDRAPLCFTFVPGAAAAAATQSTSEQRLMLACKAVVARQNSMPATTCAYHGAVYADGMGLGKTLTLGALVLLRRPAAPPSLLGGTCRVTWIDEPPAAVAANEAAEREARRALEALREARRALYPLGGDPLSLIDGAWDPHRPLPFALATRATLVLVPNTLLGQWRDTLATLAAPEAALRVVVLATTVDWNKTRYADVRLADILLVTTEFYAKHGWRVRGSSTPAVARTHLVDTLRELHAASVADQAAWEEKTAPCLPLFAWQRIVLDEAHQVLDAKLLVRLALLTTRRLRWYVSATPFPDYRQLERALDFLLGSPWRKALALTGNRFFAAVRQTLLWRQTTESLAPEAAPACGPGVRASYRALTLLPLERVAYAATSVEPNVWTNERRALCGLSTWSVDTMRPLAALMRTRLDALTASRAKCALRLEEYVASLARHLPANADAAALELPDLPEALHWIAKARNDARADTQHFTALSEAMASAVDAFDAALAAVDEAPGTAHASGKLAAVLAHVRDVCSKDASARLLLFSQHDASLACMAQHLAAASVPAGQIRGNVHQRTKVFREFTSGLLRVLLLNPRDAATGLNLVEATHVLLLDPCHEAAGRALATEQQAIGRAHRQGQTRAVTVVRFYVRGTHEESDARRNALAAGRALLLDDDEGAVLLTHPSLPANR